MSEPENANAPEEAGEKPKSKMKLIILALIVLLLLGGGGGAGYYFFLRSAPVEGDGEEHAENSKKKKKKKKSADDEEDSEDDEDEDDEDADSEMPDDEDVKHVIELKPFVVNLADGGEAHYLRITVSLGVGEEEKEKEKPNKLYLARVKNSMLSVLSAKTSEEVLSVEGKSKLRKQLLKAAQSASEEPEVLAVYITDFIVQL